MEVGKVGCPEAKEREQGGRKGVHYAVGMVCLE